MFEVGAKEKWWDRESSSPFESEELQEDILQWLEGLLRPSQIPQENGRWGEKISREKVHEAGPQKLAAHHHGKHQNQNKKWSAPKNRNVSIQDSNRVLEVDQEHGGNSGEKTERIEERGRIAQTTPWQVREHVLSGEGEPRQQQRLIHRWLFPV